MQRTNKTSAPIAAAFFIFSLAIMPFSLKVVGFTLSLNPSLSAVVDVWNQVAGSVGTVNQPLASADLLAINNLFSEQTPGATIDSASENSLLASLEQPVIEQVYEARLTDAEVEAFEDTTTTARNLKPASHSARTVKRVAAVPYYKAIQARIGQRYEALKAAETAQRVMAADHEMLKGLDKKFTGLKLDTKMFKFVSFNKDAKVFMRLKPVKPVVAPKLTACDLRRALMGLDSLETRQKEARIRALESSAVSFENSEL